MVLQIAGLHRNVKISWNSCLEISCSPNVGKMYEESFTYFSVVEYHTIIEIKFIITERTGSNQPIDLY